MTFVEIRWYTLKFVSLTVKGRFQFVEERSRTLLYAQYVEDFVFEQKFSKYANKLSINRGSSTERNLSYDVASGSEITPCNKICKPLVVYRFSGNVMTSITTLHTQCQNYNVFTSEMRFQSNLNVI